MDLCNWISLRVPACELPFTAISAFGYVKVRTCYTVKITHDMAKSWDTAESIRFTHTQVKAANVVYSCNMGMSDLADMHAQSPRAAGIHFR